MRPSRREAERGDAPAGGLAYAVGGVPLVPMLRRWGES